MSHIIHKAIKHFGTQQKLATAIGVSQASIHKWLVGTSRPTAENAMKIQHATDGEILAGDVRPDIANLFHSSQLNNTQTRKTA